MRNVRDGGCRAYMRYVGMATGAGYLIWGGSGDRAGDAGLRDRPV